MNDAPENALKCSGPGMEPVRKPRILLVRSAHKPTFCAVLAKGLLRNTSVEFSQYPRFPSDQRARLKKLYRADDAWKALHENVIETAAELRTALKTNAFDLILLADDDATLFARHDARWAHVRILADFANRACHRQFRLAREHLAYAYAMPFSLPELRAWAPVVGIENRDAVCLSFRNRKIFEHSALYFKRELPYDRLFMYYPKRPEPWDAWRKKLLREFDKVRAMPLGMEDDLYADLKSRRRATQDIDVFVSGKITNTMREEAARRVQAMGDRMGRNVVLSPSVPFDRYCELVARSKVTISVAGYRWECFRHYEAIALGSIPLMNRPTVDAAAWRGLPAEVFFENTFEDFDARIEALLADAKLRATCLQALETRVETRMLHSRVIEYILQNAWPLIRNPGAGRPAAAGRVPVLRRMEKSDTLCPGKKRSMP